MQMRFLGSKSSNISHRNAIADPAGGAYSANSPYRLAGFQAAALRRERERMAKKGVGVEEGRE